MKMTNLSPGIARVLVVGLGLCALVAATSCARKDRGAIEPSRPTETEVAREQPPTAEPEEPAPLEEAASLELRVVEPPSGAHPAAPEHGESATVEVSVAGIDLVDPAEGEEPTKGEGHLGFQLDGRGPVIATTMTRLGFHEMPPGEHEIVVTLMGNDGAPLGPRQTIKVGGKKLAEAAQPAGEGTAAEPAPKAPIRKEREKAKGVEAPKPVTAPPGVALHAAFVDQDLNVQKRMMTVEVDVDGVELIDPLSVSLFPREGQAHLHYQLDGGPIVATPSKRMTFHDLASGEHRLVVILAANDHSSLGIEQTLTLTIP